MDWTLFFQLVILIFEVFFLGELVVDGCIKTYFKEKRLNGARRLD